MDLSQLLKDNLPGCELVLLMNTYFHGDLAYELLADLHGKDAVHFLLCSQ